MPTRFRRTNTLPQSRSTRRLASSRLAAVTSSAPRAAWPSMLGAPPTPRKPATSLPPFARGSPRAGRSRGGGTSDCISHIRPSKGKLALGAKGANCHRCRPGVNTIAGKTSKKLAKVAKQADSKARLSGLRFEPKKLRSQEQTAGATCPLPALLARFQHAIVIKPSLHRVARIGSPLAPVDSVAVFVLAGLELEPDRESPFAIRALHGGRLGAPVVEAAGQLHRLGVRAGMVNERRLVIAVRKLAKLRRSQPKILVLAHDLHPADHHFLRRLVAPTDRRGRVGIGKVVAR